MATAKKQPRFGIDSRSGRILLGTFSVGLPQSRPMRIATGCALVAGGTLGFLPILGFWMVPLGLLVLSHDIPAVRRRRRQVSVWWARRRAPRKDGDRAAGR
ncbi:hypothetical protein [Ensifer soli]|uniref:hypothetical protein n=1 Tax=Ciceribacter sp. sgz301302 TaxID=3342379 RepID=UPI0035BB910D